MPPRESAIRKTLESVYPSLTLQQRRAADYILSNQRTVFAMSVQELARVTDVSEATLVRFARSLGFEGYLELRAALVDEAKRDLLPEDRFAVEEPSGEPAGTMEKVARQEVDNINRTIAQVEPKQLERFLMALRGANVIATLGLGTSALLARLAAYSFFQAGLEAQVLLRDVLSLVEQVDRLPKGAVVLAFAFPPYSKETDAALRRARERRLSVLLVTDGKQSPLFVHATAHLFTRTENVLFTNAIAGPVVLINGLATELALANKSKALRLVRQSNAALPDEYVGSGPPKKR
jgi:DNA-binding MurR/RpiR family transcriptional regulator